MIHICRLRKVLAPDGWPEHKEVRLGANHQITPGQILVFRDETGATYEVLGIVEEPDPEEPIDDSDLITDLSQ